ncbi:PRC-barrel domain-containing protein [Croceibacterium aestuarii]|uniref:PRC-barrel domain-containing protein n=1 Tax=Croceibacterium aestuarii TaxID=3064139 RepID=UPI00272EC9DE|nr:PRC-barrel domain-containing protein [Croceibacterium sp. D39]
MVDQYTELRELDDYELVNDEQDLRGHPLMTRDGRRLGTVQRMLVDPEHDHVAALVLDDGRGVPVDEIEIRDGNAYIDPVDEARYFTPPRRERAVTRNRVIVRRL